MQEVWVQSLVQEDPLRRKWQPTPIFLPGKSHGQRSLAGYSPWACKRVGHYWVTKQQEQQYQKRILHVHWEFGGSSSKSPQNNPLGTASVDGGTLIELNGGSGSFLFRFNPFPCFQTPRHTFLLLFGVSLSKHLVFIFFSYSSSSSTSYFAKILVLWLHSEKKFVEFLKFFVFLWHLRREQRVNAFIQATMF